MKIKREYLIAILVGVTAILYLIFQPAGAGRRIRAKVPKVKSFKIETIDRLSYTVANNQYEIAKEGDEWLIQPEGKRANRSTIQRMIEPLAKPQLLDKVSSGKEVGRFDLTEEKRVAVAIYSGDKKLREIYIGKLAGSASNSYITLSETGDDVFIINASLGGLYTEDTESLRDKSVLNYDRESIRGVTITFDEKELFEMVKEEDQWLVNGEEAEDETAIVSLVAGFSSLYAIKFTEAEREEVGSPQYRLTFTSDEGEDELLLYREEENEGYLSRSSQVEDWFISPEYMIGNIEKIVGAVDVKEE